MNALILNQSDTTGGAAIAARRLLEAHLPELPQTRMLVQQKNYPSQAIGQTGTNAWLRHLQFMRFAAERAYFARYEASKAVRFKFSPGLTGENLHKHPWVQQADLLHLHWPHFGFLSLRGLEKLFALGKPIVWTLHDQWVFTGGCHLTGSCNNFYWQCGNCPYLKRSGTNDLSARVHLQKQQLFSQAPPMHFITCSQWLRGRAKKSSLLQHQPVSAIPNPISPARFAPGAKAALREKYGLPNNKKYILFGATNLSDPNKGGDYLKKALQILAKQPGFKDNTALITYGKSTATGFTDLPFDVHPLSYLKATQKIVEAYNLADVFVLPSLQENLPNTIMEAQACGTPVAAFGAGGVPEMMVHKETGYVAQEKNPADLAEGIRWVLTQSETLGLPHKTRDFTKTHYHPANVSAQYRKVYESLVKQP